jgi:phosphopantetheinyl transferase (holo-ACP synthase)
LNDRRGKPIAVPRKALADYVAGLRLTAHVSLSDEADMVLAFVVLEQGAGS